MTALTDLTLPDRPLRRSAMSTRLTHHHEG